MLTVEAIQAVLAQQINPDTQRDYLSSKNIHNLRIDGASVSLDVVLGYPAQSRYAEIAATLEAAVKTLPGVERVSVQVSSQILAHTVQPGLSLLKGVKNIIAVASGKGGVGKSTTSANLALALAAEGARVGILDADIYGPSQAMIMGLTDAELSTPDDQHIQPPQRYGVQVMSIGFMVDPEQPMIWRGPMITQAMQQLLNDTLWDNLDYLVIDLPPGTGDIQLTLTQKVPVTGAVIVTTPQDIALLDARKGLKMFEKVNVPILGLVENMSMHICSNCGHTEAIFGEGGAAKMSADYGVDLLGQLPLNLSIRQGADSGQPTVAADPDGAIAEIYKTIARKVAIKVAEKAQDFSHKIPKIVIKQG